MSDLKQQLQEAGLVGSFGQPLSAGEMEEECMFCTDCVACHNKSCAVICASGVTC